MPSIAVAKTFVLTEIRRKKSLPLSEASMKSDVCAFSRQFGLMLKAYSGALVLCLSCFQPHKSRNACRSIKRDEKSQGSRSMHVHNVLVGQDVFSEVASLSDKAPALTGWQ